VALALGWRYGFLILGVVAIIIGIIAFILYKEPPRPVSSVSTDSAGPPMPILEILKNREIWMVAFCHSCFVWVEMAVIAHLVLYLTEELLFSVVTAGGLLAMVEAAGAIGRPGGGFLSDRVFGGNRKPILIMMAGTTAVVCLVVSLFGSQLSWAIYPVLFLLGLAGTGFGGVILTLVSEFGGKRGAGKATGLSTTIVMSGNILGPAVFGYIVDMSHSYQWAWLSLAFVATLCVLLLLLVKEEKRKI